MYAIVNVVDFKIFYIGSRDSVEERYLEFSEIYKFDPDKVFEVIELKARKRR